MEKGIPGRLRASVSSVQCVSSLLMSEAGVNRSRAKVLVVSLRGWGFESDTGGLDWVNMAVRARVLVKLWRRSKSTSGVWRIKNTMMKWNKCRREKR